MVQWLTVCTPSAGGPGLRPGLGTGSHTLQLKIPYAATKTQPNQIKIAEDLDLIYFKEQGRVIRPDLQRFLMEKEMATHSSILAWRIPGTEDPDGLPSMGSHRVGHD